MFGPKYGDTEFMAVLTDDMGFDSINDFLAFINIDDAEMKAGRPMTDKLLQQKMYNHWINSSEISTDRRNARHRVKCKNTKIDIAIRDLDDENVEVIANKWGKKLYSEHIKLMYQDFLKENLDDKASSSLYYRCKPFYISPANIRDGRVFVCEMPQTPFTLQLIMETYQ